MQASSIRWFTIDRAIPAPPAFQQICLHILCLITRGQGRELHRAFFSVPVVRTFRTRVLIRLQRLGGYCPRSGESTRIPSTDRGNMRHMENGDVMWILFVLLRTAHRSKLMALSSSLLCTVLYFLSLSFTAQTSHPARFAPVISERCQMPGETRTHGSAPSPSPTTRVVPPLPNWERAGRGSAPVVLYVKVLLQSQVTSRKSLVDGVRRWGQKTAREPWFMGGFLFQF